jgi:hypothetical protein
MNRIQAVNGETRVFDEREAQMRADFARAQVAALAEWRGRHSGPDYAAKIELRAEWLKTFALLALFIGLMSAIGLSVWPYLFATLKLWGDVLGGK